MLFSLTLGRYPVAIGEVARIVFTTSPFNATRDNTDTTWIVVEIVRMPRILLVTLCGMGLAMAGTARNRVKIITRGTPRPALGKNPARYTTKMFAFAATAAMVESSANHPTCNPAKRPNTVRAYR